ncbi:uncharacterized protein [Clytia hemisphaerica]|uniref:uncharacterized protein n=1 Tax=Clytia hemisphaerica TaxID=252671 RepID=UPI0034D40270|eukprot:TCONS_00002649-protein
MKYPHKMLDIKILAATIYLILANNPISAKEIIRDNIVDFLDRPILGKKIKNQTKQLLVPDIKINNDNMENDSGPAPGSPHLIEYQSYSTLRPGIHHTKDPTIHKTIATTINGKPDSGSSSSAFTGENLKTIIILLLCILLALIVFVVVHFYLTMRRTYTGVFVPRHNFVPANPFDASWIYEHIDCVPIIIQGGGEKRGSTIPFFKAKHKRRRAMITHL